MTKAGADIWITPLKNVSNSKFNRTSRIAKEEKCSVSREILSLLANFFYRIGNVVSTHPLSTIFCTLTLIALSSIGCFWLYREKESWNLWLSPDAELYQNKLWMDRHFPQNTSSESPLANGFLHSVIISGDNVISPDSLGKISRLHNRIVNHLPDYERHCIVVEAMNACANFSILGLWDYDDEIISRLTQADVQKALQTMTKRVDKHLYLMTLQDIYESPDGSSIAGARAILLTWTMVASAYEEWFLSFEENFYETVREMESEFDSLVYSGGLAFDHESTIIFQRELKYVLYGYALVFVFMVLQMRYDGNLVTGILVSIAGLGAVGLSVVLMSCCCGLMGLFWTNVSLVIPAILLGIGIDDMFVIIQTIKVDKAQEMLHPPDEECKPRVVDASPHPGSSGETSSRLAGPSKASLNRRDREAATGLLSRTLGKVGLSIFVTSLSDVLAFVVGSSFIMPATSSLCVWLGVGISFVFIIMNTFFIACLALIERFRRPRWKKEIHQSADDSLRWPFLDRLRRLLRPSSRSQRAINLDVFAHFFKKFYVPFSVTPIFSTISCVSTLGLLTVCIYGITQVELQWDVWKLIPDDSYLHHYKEMALRYFPQLTRMPLQLVFKDLNFQTDLPLIARVVETLESNKLLHAGHNWLHSLRQYIRLQADLEPASVTQLYPIDPTNGFPTNNQSFYYWVESFLESGVMKAANKNLFFDKEMVYGAVVNGTGVGGEVVNYFGYHSLRACQFTFAYDFSSRVKENANFITGLNQEILDLGIPEPNVFLFSQLFISIEQERFLPADLTRNICLSLLLIGAVVCVFFANVRMSLLCSLTVLLSLIDVFGLIHYYGLTLEPVTAMTMTILIGLGIDFSIHVGHAFIFAETKSSARADRVRAALSATGPAVIHGGLSTAIAMAPLVPSAAYAFQAFSKLIVSMVAVGLWHGLVFLPTLLLWFGPPPIGASQSVAGCLMSPRKPEEKSGNQRDCVRLTDINNNTVRRRKVQKRKKRKQICICQCVKSEKEISTVRTSFPRARQATTPVRRRAITEIRRRSRHHEKHNCHSYLVMPPSHLQRWLTYTNTNGGSTGPCGLPRIPRARIKPNEANVRGLSPQLDDPRLRMKEVNVFRPILAPEVTPTASAAAKAAFSASPASSHPACPPTPPPTLATSGFSRSLQADRDSLFNSSYHPSNDDLDGVETSGSVNPSTTMTMTPAASLTSFTTDLTTPADTDFTSVDTGDELEETLLAVEMRKKLRHTSLTISMGTQTISSTY